MSASTFRDRWARLILPVVAVLVLLADQTSKYIIASNLQRYEEWAPIPALQWFFVITYTTNTGAAFGLFPDGSLFFIIIALVVVIAILIYHRQLAVHQWLLRFSLGLQLGGALGNLLDRLTRGYVVDFIYFKFWPVFNTADSCIFVGVVIAGFIMTVVSYTHMMWGLVIMLGLFFTLVAIWKIEDLVLSRNTFRKDTP